jgi:hypothetical protein
MAMMLSSVAGGGKLVDEVVDGLCCVPGGKFIASTLVNGEDEMS